MFNTIFLFGGIFPLVTGVAYLFKPRKMLKIQTWLRKRQERLEKRLYKRHRVVGVCLTLLGLFVVCTCFQPVWIYDMFMIARYFVELMFPQVFEQMQQVSVTPMVCI